MEKYDVKKACKQLYSPPRNAFALVEVPEFRYLAVDGKGDPNTADSYADAVGQVILLGGDTDTLAAMAGGIAGARLGLSAVPPSLLGRLEDSPQGRTYLLGLARGRHPEQSVADLVTATAGPRDA